MKRPPVLFPIYVLRIVQLRPLPLFEDYIEEYMSATTSSFKYTPSRQSPHLFYWLGLETILGKDSESFRLAQSNNVSFLGHN